MTIKQLLFLLLFWTPLYALREYEKNQRPCVKELYRLNHEKQTVDFVITQKKKFSPLNQTKISIWQALERSNEIVDDSDPDLDLSQINHAFQVAESIRADGHPRWLILVGLIHDLGKMLYLFGEPQWAVVGDTFPVGCAYAPSIVFYDYFVHNPDFNNPLYQTKCGIYAPHCGLENIHMSWGHDEYLYYVIKDYVPEHASYVVRYHSFYAEHKEGSYDHLLSERDRAMMKWVKIFNQYDLYSKSSTKPNIEKLMPYYKNLVGEFFPEQIDW